MDVVELDEDRARANYVRMNVGVYLVSEWLREKRKDLILVEIVLLILPHILQVPTNTELKIIRKLMFLHIPIHRNRPLAVQVLLGALFADNTTDTTNGISKNTARQNHGRHDV